MPKTNSLPPLAELLKKSREIRIRLLMNSDYATKLRQSVEQAKNRTPQHARFSPE
jgi:hypothetical protein